MGLSPPLAGRRVLDFGRYIAGPFCGALLADLGAEVIRIEPVAGSDDRFIMPVMASGEGALFLQMNRNKRSLALDMRAPEGREIGRRLIATCDIVVVNLPPKARARIGLDYETLRAIRPDIILTTVTAYGTQGQYGDHIGFDGTGQSLSGAVHLTGTPEQPYRAAVSYVDYGTAMAAAIGTLAAVVTRLQTGVGQHVEASLLGTALTMMNPVLIEEATGARSRVATANRSPVAGPSDMFPTTDGWIFVQVLGQEMFERWTSLVGAEDLRDDPRFADDMARGDNGEALSEKTRAWCAGRSMAECLALLHAARVPGYPVLSPAASLTAPEVTGGQFLEWLPGDKPVPDVPVVRPLVRMSKAAVSPARPAPELGADTAAILESLGYSAADIGALVAAGVAGSKA